MKNSRIKLICSFLLLVFRGPGCFAQAPAQPPLTNEKGVWVEFFDSTHTEESPYTANNLIYKEGSRFTYRYYYLDKNGHKYLQKITPKAHRDREKAWKLVPLHEKDSLTHDRLQLIISDDREGIAAHTPAARYTPSRYEYFAPAGPLHFLEHKSLAENQGNVWMQPPTGRLFRILALNPFPFIRAPYAVGNQWAWQQTIPSYWGDSRWKEWSSPVENCYGYKISKEEILVTPLGSLSCLVVEAVAKSTLGTSKLISYFHPAYGFVRLLYTNIDGSQLLLELVQHQE